MRTTLDIDDRVLAIARARARAGGVSLGRAISDLALEALEGRYAATSSEVRIVVDARTGFPVIEVPGAPIVTDELVAEVRDEW